MRAPPARAKTKARRIETDDDEEEVEEYTPAVVSSKSRGVKVSTEKKATPTDVAKNMKEKGKLAQPKKNGYRDADVDSPADTRPPPVKKLSGDIRRRPRVVPRNIPSDIEEEDEDEEAIDFRNRPAEKKPLAVPHAPEKTLGKEAVEVHPTGRTNHETLAPNAKKRQRGQEVDLPDAKGLDANDRAPRKRIKAVPRDDDDEDKSDAAMATRKTKTSLKEGQKKRKTRKVVPPESSADEGQRCGTANGSSSRRVESMVDDEKTKGKVYVARLLLLCWIFWIVDFAFAHSLKNSSRSHKENSVLKPKSANNKEGKTVRKSKVRISSRSFCFFLPC